MATITCIAFDGTEHEVEARAGDTLMSAAVDNSVPGIDGDCGGNCACATCHIFVEGALAGGAGEEERDMLAIADDVRDTSRLGCQITVTDEHGWTRRAPANGRTLKPAFAGLPAALPPSPVQ